MKLVPLAVLAAVLAFPVSAAAEKPSKIYLFHVTHVEATSELKLSDGTTASTRIDVDLPRKGWRGRRNAGFWGTKGWGTIAAPLKQETWNVHAAWQEEREDDDGNKTVEQKTCDKTGKVEDRKIFGEFDRAKGKDVVKLKLPASPYKLPCGVEFPWVGSDQLDPVTIPIGRTQMTRPRTTIAFEHSVSQEKATVTWKGTLSIEKGYQCTVPPDYPCHTMLM